MTEYLRSHSLVTLLASGTLVLAGILLFVLPDTEEISSLEMLGAIAGFLLFCVGIVGIMIVIFRPIELSRSEAASWEMIRNGGKPRFIGRVVLGGLPFFGGLLFLLLWERESGSGTGLAEIAVVTLLCVGTTALVASELWKMFERQHSKFVAEQEKRPFDTRAAGGQESYE